MIKRLVIAIVVAYFVLMGTNWLVHGVILMPDYNAIPDSHRSPDDIQRRMWIMAIGQFLFAALFTYIYTKGAETKPWVAQGIRYGLLMTFFTVVPYSLSEYVTYVIPHTLAIKWMVFGAIQLVILGLLVAAIWSQPSHSQSS
jgi:hypothetical protein